MLKMMIVDQNDRVWDIIVTLSMSLAGLSNSLIYFLQRRSLVGGNQHTKMEKLELLATERSYSMDNMLCREPRPLEMEFSMKSTPSDDLAINSQ